MPDSKFATKPVDSEKMPGGIPYIIGNEAAERFSFYGMRGILTVYMTKHLVDSTGAADTMSDEDAKTVYHLFVAIAYFFPILGSLLADIVWGKYKTILILSLGYCVGHFCLSMGDTGGGAALLEPRNWLFLGLVFIAIGSGGIKPCVSAHVGDQFGPRNQGLLTKTFSWFYFSINIGAAASNLVTPALLEHPDYGPAYAFGLPGVLMALATLMFWMGRKTFVHIPPGGKEKFLEETLNPDGVRALRNLSPLFLIFVPTFWALFDQTGSAWILQATRLDRNFLGFEWYEAQVQAVNPVLILLLIPAFAYGVYPAMGRFFEPTPLRKIGIGLFMAALAFGVSAWIESRLTGGAVVKTTSEADRDRWRAIHLLDGSPDLGWLSAPADPAKEAKPEEIILRLRDFREWPIDRIVVQPLADDAAIPEPEPDKTTRERSVAACRAKRIVFSIADAPKPPGGWREISTLDLDDGAEPVEASFSEVEASYLRISITANHGGDFVGLGEVEVIASGPPATGAGPVWPNVAALGDRPTIGWQFLAYLILTAAEVMVSIVCLEFAYTQAPKAMKSFIMGVYFLGVSLGNLVTAGVNWYIANPDGTSKLQGVNYYTFFTAVTAAVAVAYVFWSRTYRGRTYIQGAESGE